MSRSRPIPELTRLEKVGLRKVDVPEGENGRWRVERFEVSEKDAKFHNLREDLGSMQGRGRPRYIDPGTYTRLRHGKKPGGYVVMSDTPAELEDHYEVARRANGRVLINGLGLGVVLQSCLDNPSVRHVTVVEIEEDVLELVGPHYQFRYGVDRLDLVHANALKWKAPRGSRWDVVWHDIWTGIDQGNLEIITYLKRKYGSRCTWQGAWLEEEIREMNSGHCGG